MKQLGQILAIAAIIIGVMAGLVWIGAYFHSRELQTEIHEQANGDYRLVVTGRALVCEEKAVTITQQPDAVTPLVIECKH